MNSLVVDDEFVALSKLVSLLTPLGPCDAATSGNQALKLFSKALKNASPYDLVTIDIEMSDMNGIALLGRLQQEEQVQSGKRARKIMISGKCDAFLVKPVKQATLLAKLAELGLIPSGQA
jgi:two-component system chemotaxis response regulator CheY